MLTLNGKLCLGASNAKYYKRCDGTMTSNTQSTANIKNASVWCGSGTTPPNVNDYALANPITELTQVSNTYATCETFGSDFVETITTTWQNNTSSDITVTEIGAMGYNTQAVLDSKVMIAREVIEPVVIPANGGQKTFTLQIG